MALGWELCCCLLFGLFVSVLLCCSFFVCSFVRVVWVCCFLRVVVRVLLLACCCCYFIRCLRRCFSKQAHLARKVKGSFYGLWLLAVVRCDCDANYTYYSSRVQYSLYYSIYSTLVLVHGMRVRDELLKKSIDTSNNGKTVDTLLEYRSRARASEQTSKEEKSHCCPTCQLDLQAVGIVIVATPFQLHPSRALLTWLAERLHRKIEGKLTGHTGTYMT